MGTTPPPHATRGGFYVIIKKRETSGFNLLVIEIKYEKGTT